MRIPRKNNQLPKARENASDQAAICDWLRKWHQFSELITDYFRRSRENCSDFEPAIASNTYSVGMFSAFVTIQHKICKTEQVSLQLASFPLQLVKHFVNETIHFACLVRCRLKSLDTMQSSARKFKTDKDEALWCRNWCRRSTQFSLDGWSNFFATKLAKFPFVLDLLFVVFEEVTRAINVVKATTCGRIIVALADGESLIAPNSKKFKVVKSTLWELCVLCKNITQRIDKDRKRPLDPQSNRAKSVESDQDLFWFCFCYVIGPQNLRYSLNNSDSKLKLIAN